MRLEIPDGVTANKEQVSYSIWVGRYVEVESRMKVSKLNVPAQKSLLTLPSEVQVKCRIPFGARQNTFLNSLSVSVDYGDVIKSRTTKLIPKVINGSKVPLYGYEISPSVVECVIIEN